MRVGQHTRSCSGSAGKAEGWAGLQAKEVFIHKNRRQSAGSFSIIVTFYRFYRFDFLYFLHSLYYFCCAFTLHVFCNRTGQ